MYIFKINRMKFGNYKSVALYLPSSGWTDFYYTTVKQSCSYSVILLRKCTNKKSVQPHSANSGQLTPIINYIFVKHEAKTFDITHFFFREKMFIYRSCGETIFHAPYTVMNAFLYALVAINASVLPIVFNDRFKICNIVSLYNICI